jgi:hypothetical protein
MCVVADDVSPGLGLGGEDSPWAHEMPVPPAPRLPDSWARSEPQPPAPEPPGPAQGDDDGLVPVPPIAPRRSRPALIGFGLVGIVAALFVGSQFIGGDGDAETASDVEPSIAEPQTTERPRKTIPPPTSTERVRPSTSASLPEPDPVWTSAPISLHPRIQAMTEPTQVVVLDSDSVLHVIDLPAGVVRSIDTKVGGADLALVVGDEAIAVRSYNGGGVTVVNVDGPLVEVDIPGGAGEMLARPGTNDFVVTPNSWSSAEPENLLVAADGTTTDIENGPLRDYGIWGVRYLAATGEAVVNDSGGTYAIDATGASRRLSTGTMVALGENHLLVRECTENLVCDFTRIDARSGERLDVELPDLDQYRGYDPSMTMSPDGSMVTYFDWMQSPVARRLVHMIDGTSTEVDSIDQYGNNAAWAADSSGIFIIEDRTLAFYDRVTSDRIEVAPGVDLGGIVAVASRSRPA